MEEKQSIPDGKHNNFRFTSNAVSSSYNLKGDALFSGTIKNGTPIGYCKIVYLNDTETVPSHSVIGFMSGWRFVGRVIRQLNVTNKNNRIINWQVFEDTDNNSSCITYEYTDSDVRKNEMTIIKESKGFITKTTSLFCPLYFHTEVTTYSKDFKDAVPSIVRVPFIPFHELTTQFGLIGWYPICDYYMKRIGQTEFDKEDSGFY